MRGRHQIKASAGSGKTYRLTQEFLLELANCDRRSGGSFKFSSHPHLRAVNQLLAITFTNAAATEMRARVIKRLKEIALGAKSDIPLDPEAAKRWLEAILRDINSLNIRTIDSLLHLITRSGALALELNPDFEPGFSTEEIFSPYLERFLDLADEDEIVRSLVLDALKASREYGSNQGFMPKATLEEDLFNILDNVLQGNFKNLSPAAELEAKLQEIRNDAAQACEAMLEQAEKEKRSLHKTARGMLEKAAAGDIHPSSKYLYEDNPKTFSGKGELLPETLASYAHVRQMLARYRNLGSILASSIRLLSSIAIAKSLADRFAGTGSAILPNVQIPGLAAKILASGGVPDAVCRLGSRIGHLLIDEFQDTSHEQWDVLASLAEEGLSKGGSLTWVGDVKQSIYSWRGGDPALFEDVKDDKRLSRIAPDVKTTPLEVNWRSKPVIIEHTNKLFAPLASCEKMAEILDCAGFGDAPEEIRAEMAQAINTAYQDVEQQCNDKSGIPGFVHAETISGRKVEDADALVLERMAEILDKWIAGRRPWSDVLVLCRKKEHCASAAAMLLEKNIPVITENSLLIGDHPLVVQMLDFLHFLENPANDLAFWGVVSGSLFCGHPEAELDPQFLSEWAAGLPAEPKSKKTPLFERFAAFRPKAWEHILKPFHSQASLLPPYDLVMEWCSRLDVERRFPKDRTFVRRFLEILHGAEQEGFRSIASFLDYWAEKGTEELAPLPESANAARIMTIHKSKGLEAPVVIAPWTDFRIQPSEALVEVEIEGLKIAAPLTNKYFGAHYWQNYSRQFLEALNLLYVTFTRAKDELYFFLPAPETVNSPTLRPVIEILAGFAGFTNNSSPAAGLEPKENISPFYALGALPPKEKKDAEADEATEPGNAEFPKRKNFIREPSPDFIGPVKPWRPMEWLPELKLFRARAGEKTLSAEERGLFMHYCLEKLTMKNGPQEDAERSFQFALRHGGVTVPEDPGLRQALLENLVWFASLPEAGSWLAHGLPEQPLLDRNGRLLRADLIVPEEDGALIIDYKTGQPRPAYHRQLQNYMRCLKDSGLFPGKLRGLLVYLDARSTEAVAFDPEPGA